MTKERLQCEPMRVPGTFEVYSPRGPVPSSRTQDGRVGVRRTPDPRGDRDEAS